MFSLKRVVQLEKKKITLFRKSYQTHVSKISFCCAVILKSSILIIVQISNQLEVVKIRLGTNKMETFVLKNLNTDSITNPAIESGSLWFRCQKLDQNNIELLANRKVPSGKI